MIPINATNSLIFHIQRLQKAVGTLFLNEGEYVCEKPVIVDSIEGEGHFVIPTSSYSRAAYPLPSRMYDQAGTSGGAPIEAVPQPAIKPLVAACCP